MSKGIQPVNMLHEVAIWCGPKVEELRGVAYGYHRDCVYSTADEECKASDSMICCLHHLQLDYLLCFRP